MKNCMRKICCVLAAAVLVSMVPQHIVQAGERKTDVSNQADEVVLTIGVGNDVGEVGYDEYTGKPDGGSGSGPENFAVTEDGTIYVVDNENQRVNVYRDGKFLYDVAIPYQNSPLDSYVRSIVVSQGLIYLMDYDEGMIYKLDVKGNVRKEISLPKGMNKLSMRKLYVRDDGTVWLYYYDESKKLGNGKKGVNCSYSVNDLAKGKTDGIEGYTKDGDSFCSICGRCLNLSSGEAYRKGDYYVSGITRTIPLVKNASLAAMSILNVDKNDSVYVDVFEMEDSSIVTGEYTVRKYVNGKCEGTAFIDLDSYYYMPYKVLVVSEEGDLYQMICYENKIQIIKKAFVR